MFALSRGSNGFGNERYRVYLPFTLEQGISIESLDQPYSTLIDKYSLSLEKTQNRYAVSLGDFNSPNEAIGYSDKIRASLLWFSLSLNYGVLYPTTNGNITSFDKHIPVSDGLFSSISKKIGWDFADGHFNAEECVVTPEHKKLIRVEMSNFSMNAGINLDFFIQLLMEAYSFPDLGSVLGNKKLKLAIEIFSTYRFERSANARLITLVTALEAVRPGTKIPKHSRLALSKSMKVLKEERDKLHKDSIARKDLDRLLSQTGKLKAESIGTDLRNFATSVAEKHPTLGEIHNISERLKLAYDARSKLLHDGDKNENEFNESLKFLSEFVPAFLKILFQDAAGVK